MCGIASVVVALITVASGVFSQNVNLQCSLNMGAEANRRFAYELYAKAVLTGDDPKANVFLAPTSVASALAMILVGADGDTKDQIWNGLKLNSTSQQFTDDDLPCLLRSYSPPQRNKEKRNRTLVLRTANKLFGEKTFDFDDAFLKKTSSLGAKIKKLDFVNDPGSSRTDINDWVAKRTHNKIPNLFNEGDVSSDTILAIASAIYFKGLWKYKFNPASTERRAFQVDELSTVRPEFMKSTEMFRERSFPTLLRARMLELPYSTTIDTAHTGYTASMIIVLPENSMEETESRLTEENLTPAIRQLLESSPHKTMLKVPKFTIKGDYDLGSILTSMGVKDMFLESLADLSLMRGHQSPDHRPLYVSSAVHKTFIKVGEEGTEASAATGMLLMGRSAFFPPSFSCDKPFIVIIYEKNSESVLFIGKVNDPTKA